MKKKRFDQNSIEHIIVSPDGAPDTEDELFDDCPLCQELKKDIAAGRARPIREDDWKWKGGSDDI